MDNATVVAELAAIKAQRKTMQRTRFRKSRLLPYRGELVALKQGGASLRDLVQWLKNRRIKVAHTTVLRYLQSLPELDHAQLP